MLVRSRLAAVTVATVGLAAPLAVLAAPAQAAYPGTNRFVAYTVNYGSANNIFRQFRDGTGKQKLTTNGASSDPTFSPDGKKIAYRDRGTLAFMNADGSGKRRTSAPVAGGYGAHQRISWTPDGTKVAVVTADGIRVYTSAGVLKKTVLSGTYSRVSYNPADANQILVDDRTIYNLASLSYSTVVIDATSPDERVGSVNWMPNGSILFVSNCDQDGACTDAGNIFVTSVSGGARRNMSGRTDANQTCSTQEGNCNTIDEAVASPDGRDFLARGNEGSGAGVEYVFALHAKAFAYGDPFSGDIFLGDWQGS